MLGKIARKLRFFGFDTLYMVHAHDDDVLDTGMREGRIILTADRELFKRIVKRNGRAVLVDSDSEIENMVHIFSKAGIDRIDLDGADSRCPQCGSSLSERSPKEMTGIVPDPIISRYRRFFQCSKCSRAYWEGGHYARVRLLAERINAQLVAVH